MEEKESLRIFHEGKTETKKDASDSVGIRRQILSITVDIMHISSVIG